MDKTKPQRTNAKQVQQFLADAQKRVGTARRNLAIDAEAAFQIAYEAMIKGSLALMLSHGQRPRKQLGHHIAIIEFAQKHLQAAKPAVFSLFDRMRRKRNDAFLRYRHRERYRGGRSCENGGALSAIRCCGYPNAIALTPVYALVLAIAWTRPGKLRKRASGR